MCAQPTLNQVHVNRPLTNISTAIIQSAENFIADKMFPGIPVEKKTDNYFVYKQNDWFRDEAKPRAPGTESAGSGFNISTDTYTCVVEALHKDVDDQTRANADTGIEVDRDATEFITNSLLIRREKKWADAFFVPSVWATDFTPANLWSDFVLSTPIKDIQDSMNTILAATGIMPNTFALGWDVFATLKNHPDIRERINPTGADRLSTTENIMAQIFGIERLIVAKAVIATNVEGEPDVYSFIQGKNALMVFSQPSPGLRRPSGGYTFNWSGLAGNTAGVKMDRFRMPKLSSDRVEGEMACDQKLVSAPLGFFFEAVVT